ncbi:MAG: hypothetical protein E7351_04020 [Clostridiales bacterium]|nr:hypothetical protein [Clostridiales bacterium]
MEIQNTSRFCETLSAVKGVLYEEMASFDKDQYEIYLNRVRSIENSTIKEGELDFDDAADMLADLMQEICAKLENINTNNL